MTSGAISTDDAHVSDVQGDTPDGHRHAALVLLAEKWLRRQNCGVVFRDAFRAITEHGEQPDAIGWRHGLSILIECKVTRTDFLADKRKPFRMDPAKGVGDWRFYLCPKGLISVEDLPIGWGLLYADGARIKPVHGVPPNTAWWSGRPFSGEKRCETQMLYSACRRMELRGHLSAIYDPMLGTGPSGPS